MSEIISGSNDANNHSAWEGLLGSAKNLDENLQDDLEHIQNKLNKPKFPSNYTEADAARERAERQSIHDEGVKTLNDYHKWLEKNQDRSASEYYQDYSGETNLNSKTGKKRSFNTFDRNLIKDDETSSEYGERLKRNSDLATLAEVFPKRPDETVQEYSQFITKMRNEYPRQEGETTSQYQERINQTYEESISDYYKWLEKNQDRSASEYYQDYSGETNLNSKTGKKRSFNTFDRNLIKDDETSSEYGERLKKNRDFETLTDIFPKSSNETTEEYSKFISKIHDNFPRQEGETPAQYQERINQAYENDDILYKFADELVDAKTDIGQTLHDDLLNIEEMKNNRRFDEARAEVLRKEVKLKAIFDQEALGLPADKQYLFARLKKQPEAQHIPEAENGTEANQEDISNAIDNITDIINSKEGQFEPKDIPQSIDNITDIINEKERLNHEDISNAIDNITDIINSKEGQFGSEPVPQPIERNADHLEGLGNNRDVIVNKLQRRRIRIIISPRIISKVIGAALSIIRGKNRNSAVNNPVVNPSNNPVVPNEQESSSDELEELPFEDLGGSFSEPLPAVPYSNEADSEVGFSTDIPDSESNSMTLPQPSESNSEASSEESGNVDLFEAGDKLEEDVGEEGVDYLFGTEDYKEEDGEKFNNWWNALSEKGKKVVLENVPDYVSAGYGKALEEWLQDRGYLAA